MASGKLTVDAEARSVREAKMRYPAGPAVDSARLGKTTSPTFFANCSASGRGFGRWKGDCH